jgi:hypothetical protein
MEKGEFLEKFASSKATIERNNQIEKIHKGAIKFDYRKNIVFEDGEKEYIIDYGELCVYPAGLTLNLYEICPNFDGVELDSFIREVRERNERYFQSWGAKGRMITHFVIPPDKDMIFALGDHLDSLEGASVIVYDADKDKRGCLLIEEDFFRDCRESEDFKSMEDPEIFSTFLLNFVEAL